MKLDSFKIFYIMVESMQCSSLCPPLRSEEAYFFLLFALSIRKGFIDKNENLCLTADGTTFAGTYLPLCHQIEAEECVEAGLRTMKGIKGSCGIRGISRSYYWIWLIQCLQ